jgi:ribosomal protein L32E
MQWRATAGQISSREKRNLSERTEAEKVSYGQMKTLKQRHCSGPKGLQGEPVMQEF